MTDNKNEIIEEDLESVTGGKAAEKITEDLNAASDVVMHNMPKITPHEKYVM